MCEKKTVAVLLLGFLPNPRIYKRISLEKDFFKLHVICWDRGSNMLLPPIEDEYVAHVIKINACNDPVKRMVPYLRFYNRARRLLDELQPKLIHVQGLDMLQIAIAYRKKHPETRVIYEVADLHRLIVDSQHNPIYALAQQYLKKRDKSLSREYDLLITTSSQYIDKYFNDFVLPQKQLVIPNVPDLKVFHDYKKKEKDSVLTIGFIGGIRYKAQIRNLLFAAQVCKMNVLLAGFENGGDEIEKLCASMPNVEWVGRYEYDRQISSLYGKCDLIYSVYDANMANVRVALPNKLYEAIWCEVPLIVAKNTYLGEIVTDWGVGVAVDCNSQSELESALHNFQENRELFDIMEAQCRAHKSICDLEHYNQRLSAIIESWVNN